MTNKNFNLVFGNREMFKRHFKNAGRHVPLSEREDWDGVVEVIPPEDEPARKTFGRIQGKKKRNARNKR